jgi:hypothetical protein
MAVAKEKDDNSIKTSAPGQTQELAGIEVLRFLSALAILIWHYHQFFFVGEVDGTQAISLRPEQPFYRPLQFAYEGGFWAVEVFWGISGFILYWTYARPIADRAIGHRTPGVRDTLVFKIVSPAYRHPYDCRGAPILLLPLTPAVLHLS